MGKLLQYQAFAEPVTVPPPTMDTWNPNTNIPARNWAKVKQFALAAVAPFIFFSNIYPPSTHIFSNSTVNIPSSKVVQYQGTAFAHTDIVSLPTTDELPDWQYPIERPPDDLKRNQHQYPSFFIDDYLLTQPENITIDKWLGYQPDINFDVTRQQYTYPSFKIDDFHLADPERPDLDKWIGYHPDIIFDRARTQYNYPPWAGLEEEPTEEVSFQEWYQNTERPRFDIKRWQHTYPSFFYDTYQFTQPESVSFDKWSFLQSTPRWDVKRNQFTYPYWIGTEEEPETEVSVDSWYFVNRNPIPQRKEQWVYPSFFAHIEEEPTEEVSVDSWFVNTSIPKFDIRRWQFIYPSFVTDNESLGDAEITTVDRYIGYYPDYIFDLHRNQHIYPYLSFDSAIRGITVFSSQSTVVTFTKTYQYQSSAFTHLAIAGAEEVTADKWIPNTEKPQFNFKPRQHIYPYYVTDDSHTGDAETVTFDKYHFQQSIPRFDIRRQQYVYPFWSGTEEEAPEEVSVNEWFLNTNIPRFDSRRWQFNNPPWTGLEEEPAEEVSIDTWVPNTEKPRWDVKREQYLYPYFDIDSYQLTRSESISLDKWFKETERPRWDIKRQQTVYPTFFGRTEEEPETEVSIDSWFVNTYTPKWDIKRNQYLYPVLSIDNARLTDAEAVSIDRWAGYHPDIVFDLKRNQFLYPSFSFETSLKGITVFSQQSTIVVFTRQLQYQTLASTFPEVAAAEVITTDKWHPNTNIPKYDRARNQFLYPSLAIDPYQLTQAEAITIDKWFKEAEKPRWSKKQWQAIYPSTDFRVDLFIPTEAPVDGWFQEIERPLPQKLRPYHYPYFVTDPYWLSQPEVISVDKWFVRTATPRWDIKRQQHTYPHIDFSALEDIITEMPIEAWFVETERPRREKFRPYYYPYFNIDPTLTAELVSFDRWYQNTNTPRFDKKRLQALYPIYCSNIEPVIFTASLDMWYYMIPNPVLPLFKGYYFPIYSNRDNFECFWVNTQDTTFATKNMTGFAVKNNTTFSSKNSTSWYNKSNTSWSTKKTRPEC